MQNKERLSAGEISNLWIHYINETMSLCVNRYMLTIIKNMELQNIFKTAIETGNNHIKILKDFFRQENFPIPKGFSEEDVNLNAPPLFTDNYCLFYLLSMTIQGLQQYGLAISLCLRKDIRKFYYQCNEDSMNLYDQVRDLAFSQNLHAGSPLFSNPKKVEFIDSYNYVTDVFGKRRKMNSVESANIFYNLEKSKLIKSFALASRQVCKDDEIVGFLDKYINMVSGHLGTFTNLLIHENLTTGHTFDTEITNSTTSPFSERLFMYHIGLLIASSITYYSAALITNLRADIAFNCEKAILDNLANYGKYGKLMIKKSWVEKPPYADNRNSLQ